MLLALMGWVHAAEPERLEGFHFGLGAGLSFYTWSSTSGGDTSSGTSTSTTMTMRFRLGKVVTIEPNVRGGHQVARGWNVVPAEGEPAERMTSDSYRLGARARVRLAAVDRLDLVGMAGIAHERSWRANEPATGARQTAFQADTDAEIGVGIEYWLARRVNVSAEMDTDVLGWTVMRQEPDDDVSDSFWLGFSPSGRVLVHLWF